jgi:hypothetical protein
MRNVRSYIYDLWELITDASSPVRKSVAYKCGVGGRIKTDCVSFLEMI